jgi:hypothetical protein
MPYEIKEQSPPHYSTGGHHTFGLPNREVHVARREVPWGVLVYFQHGLHHSFFGLYTRLYVHGPTMFQPTCISNGRRLPPATAVNQDGFTPALREGRVK